MKRTLLSLFIITLSATAFAQSYAEKAAAIQKEVCGTKVPEFGATTVPANLSNESAVILARAYSLQKTSTGKFKFMILTAASTTKTVKMSTFHERVKINDKAALEDFSTLEYQKKLDNTVSMLTARFRNTKDTYIGAKIIKADGKEIIVNTGEEVLLKNEAKDQKGKLAISNLQVGDILDYYISIAQTDETGLQDNFADNDQLFVLAGEYPVLYYSLDFQFNKKTIVKYISANGAPKFEEGTNADKDIIYKLVTRNLPKYQTQMWLIPAGDVDNILMELSKSDPLADRLAKYPETKKKRDAFTYAFANDRQQQVKKFTEEIKKQYDQEPQQVTDTKIINTGLYSNKPVFEYSATFVLDNLVKKAGNNLIIDAGKLAGTFLKLEEKDRVRTLDVYMPLARTYTYNINIAIPKGYAAKGLDEFNKQLSNSTGSFTCTAKLNGDNVNISVSRVYSSNFEKPAAWPQLTQIVDAAAQFNTQKILFEKL